MIPKTRVRYEKEIEEDFALINSKQLVIRMQNLSSGVSMSMTK